MTTDPSQSSHQTSFYLLLLLYFFPGNACRDKLRRYLKVKFESHSDAEEAYNINYFDDCPVMQEFPSTTTSTPIPQSAEVPHSVSSPLLSLSPLRNSDDRKLPG